MLVLDDSTPVRKFTAADAADMPAFYRALRARRERAHLRVVPKKEMPAPVVRTIDVAEAVEKRRIDSIVLPIARPRPDYVPEERDWLKVATADQAAPEYTVRQLACIAGRQFDVLVAEVFSARRHASLCYVRHVVCWLAKRFTVLSLPQIGKHLGGRDHTTVLHGVRRIQAIVDRHNLSASSNTPEAWAEVFYAISLGEVWRQ